MTFNEWLEKQISEIVSPHGRTNEEWLRAAFEAGRSEERDSIIEECAAVCGGFNTFPHSLEVVGIRIAAAIRGLKGK